MSFENVGEVVEVRDQESANERLAAGWSLLAVVPGFDRGCAYTAFVLGKIVSNGEKAAQQIREKHGANAVLVGVCDKAGKVLAGNELALEVLQDYNQDALAGRLTRDRLRGFLQGLFSARVLPVEDYAELDRELS